MVERLRIAVGKSLEIVAVEYASCDELRQDHQEAVCVGDRACDQRFVDHRQPLIAVAVAVELDFVFVSHPPTFRLVWAGAQGASGEPTPRLSLRKGAYLRDSTKADQ